MPGDPSSVVHATLVMARILDSKVAFFFKDEARPHYISTKLYTPVDIYIDQFLPVHKKKQDKHLSTVPNKHTQHMVISSQLGEPPCMLGRKGDGERR